MICRRCGEQLPDTARICSFCGNVIADKEYGEDTSFGVHDERARERRRKQLWFKVLVPLFLILQVGFVVVLVLFFSDKTGTSNQTSLDISKEETTELKRVIMIPKNSVHSNEEIVLEELEVKGEDVPTTEQAKEALVELIQKGLAFCKMEDSEGFTSLYYEPSKHTEEINNSYDYYREVLQADYPNWQYSIVYGDGNHFCGYAMNALTTGKYPNTRSLWKQFTVAFSCIDGEWLIDLSDENLKVLNAGVESLYPSEMHDARNKTGNAVILHKREDYSWLDTNIYVYDCVQADVDLLWQNEDGSLDFLLNIKNGTDEIRRINSVTVTATDDALGEIFSKTFGDDNIKPHSAKNYTLHIDASEVKTGMQTWGNVHTQCKSTHT